MTRALKLLIVLALASWSWAAAPQEIGALPARSNLRFAVIGDNGTGQTPQYDVARQMLKTHGAYPFELVLMVGDNMYGSQRPRDFVDKFEVPYGPLLRMGIPFYAALGNHDEPDNRKYPKFNMNGERYYSVARGDARFFFLDTNFLDAPQLQWFERALRDAAEEWKVVVLHHPLYSSGDRHGPNVSVRVALEPMLVRYGADVVFTGHEHIYERVKPQKGIVHFIVGSSGQLRRDGVTPSAMTAASFAQDQVFLVASIDGPELAFQAISRTGVVVDSGVLRGRAMTEK